MQPIRITESRCIFDDITCNLPVMRREYVAMIALATIYYTAWYKILMQRSLVVYNGISHLSLVFSPYTQSPLEIIQVTRGISHGIPLESFA